MESLRSCKIQVSFDMFAQVQPIQPVMSGWRTYNSAPGQLNPSLHLVVVRSQSQSQGIEMTTESTLSRYVPSQGQLLFLSTLIFGILGCWWNQRLVLGTMVFETWSRTLNWLGQIQSYHMLLKFSISTYITISLGSFLVKSRFSRTSLLSQPCSNYVSPFQFN